MKTHSLVVENRFFTLIASGRKIVEARVNKYPYSEINAGDLFDFQVRDDLTKSCLCLVKSRFVYKDFRELLEKEGLENCLPGAENIEKGVAIYNSFSNYKTEVEKYHAVAFRIQLFENHL